MEMADDGRKKCRRVFTKDKLMTEMLFLWLYMYVF